MLRVINLADNKLTGEWLFSYVCLYIFMKQLSCAIGYRIIHSYMGICMKYA